MKEKILIIKTGYSEILDRENDSRRVSLGDVLRTTPLLHLYKNDEVTWVTDREAFPIIEGNKFVTRLLYLDWITAEQLRAEEFDRVINLEKVPGICALSDAIRSRKSRYGFNFNRQTGRAEAYDHSVEVLTVSSDAKEKKENKKTTQELLFEMVGKKWNGESYVLGYKSKSREVVDIGLNTQIGSKWPTKAWPVDSWNILEKKLKECGYNVSRQDKQDKKILINLYTYMDWINSCKTIVTNDSLGVHLAIAMGKKVLCLFGPTPAAEIYFYGRGKPILPSPLPECVPCFSSKCDKYKDSCMKLISPERVAEEVKSLVKLHK